jgi:hypothetical protein
MLRVLNFFIPPPNLPLNHLPQELWNSLSSPCGQKKGTEEEEDWTNCASVPANPKMLAAPTTDITYAVKSSVGA